MNCAECERLIFTYEELNTTERKRVDDHVAICQGCASLFVEIQRSQSLLKNILKDVPEKLENENPFLTSKIISAIESTHNRFESIIERFIPVARFAFMRYTMAITSIALLIIFIIELNPMDQAEKAVTFYKRTPITKTVRLNSSAFRDQLRNSLKQSDVDMASSATLSKCLKECVDNSNENCKDCSNLFNKIKNEGI